ncbi:microtubule-associated protein futsch isoform X2 [Pieris rapae]|uniref:microtubule-associated protein futsch isoform X2 n=1 Tax=Pieris rapae TaxID=64459 RepID=UPI001E27B4C7|nr:microtubule-associated protein futsch isoform X2 [Pieris rapae]
MSDNEDILGEDLGDHSLADYNLGNEEEEQLLADDYEGNSQNVPSGGPYRERTSVPADYNETNVQYTPPAAYTTPETECVVPNITVEIPGSRADHCTYAPYEPSYEAEHAVPPAIPAAPIESPQIVPSEISPAASIETSRERFISERPVGARTPQVRNIPDSLDNVFVPRGRNNSWRAPHYRHNHPYRRHNAHYRGNFGPRPSFPPPQRVSPPHIRPELDSRPDLLPERQILPEPRENFPHFQRFPFRPEERPNFIPNQPFERPMFPFGPSREIIPHNNIPQVTIRQPLPGLPAKSLEPEVRMLPVLPPNLPGLTGKKVLINPHFKGNFQPPVEGPIKDIDDAAERFIAEQRSALARAATRNLARRSPQRFIENTTIEIENELARSRRSEDELLRKQEEFIHANRAGLRRRMRTPSPRRSRSPSPLPRDSREPRDVRDSRDVRDTRDLRDREKRDERRPRPQDDEDSEYRRRVREQESMRERVLRAKEVRRRKNAVALQKQLQDKEREKQDKKEEPKVETKENPSSTREEEVKPDTTKKSPEREEKEIERKEKTSPLRDEVEVNSTCEALTPPRGPSPLTPPLPPPVTRGDSDDDLDLILGDIDGILSDDEDSARPEDDDKRVESSKPQSDLRTKLPPRSEKKPPSRQKIIFTADEEARRKEKSPLRRTTVSSSTKVVESNEKPLDKEKVKRQQLENASVKSRQRIVFETKKVERADEDVSQKFSNRRVILQRKTAERDKSVFSRIEKTDPTKPNPGIFNRAFKTAVGSDKIDGRKRARDVRRVVGTVGAVERDDEPKVEYESGSDEENLQQKTGSTAAVRNLPHGITDTRLKTLAGDHVQSLILDKETRSAKLTFKTSAAAETFKRKFHNKMVSASQLIVTLQ